ncbi:hypothetical protein K493DRAFT_68403 [Basidiobolus meristosporus CBS 931.73]|uniref:Uncharacterized protein n=1 Tax=Basidiobolus meristosporus CBS 931.73 TaxID=1314790 RepID=A0A1Y1XUL3_9FUNG|nr:hypothetical protein K493DRAFT_68403 [Basidiobolus meristosporus CBS 931.73]|eukprot:ORX89452.1 hypothetical protein K493DRAFT_68403 [Basidiobolus meristosporus CBS 931.73]
MSKSIIELSTAPNTPPTGLHHIFALLYFLYYCVICCIIWYTTIHTVDLGSTQLQAYPRVCQLRSGTRTRSYANLESCLASRPSKRLRSSKIVRFSRFQRVFDTYSPEEYDRSPAIC